MRRVPSGSVASSIKKQGTWSRMGNSTRQRVQTKPVSRCSKVTLGSQGHRSIVKSSAFIVFILGSNFKNGDLRETNGRIVINRSFATLPWMLPILVTAKELWGDKPCQDEAVYRRWWLLMRKYSFTSGAVSFSGKVSRVNTPPCRRSKSTCCRQQRISAAAPAR